MLGSMSAPVASEPAPLYLVDGFNFLHAVVLRGRDRGGWWRPEMQRSAVEWVASLPVAASADVWVIFDRRGSGSSDEGLGLLRSAVEIRHAPDADEYILALCEELRGRRPVVVVSADRSLVDRAKHRGARGLSPWDFAR